MRAVFVADGPFARRTTAQLRIRSGVLEQSPGVYSRDSRETLIPGFANLELYGLVTKILGLTPAPNNGTEGFWDQYF
jgi:hypothetical protein